MFVSLPKINSFNLRLRELILLPSCVIRMSARVGVAWIVLMVRSVSGEVGSAAVSSRSSLATIAEQATRYQTTTDVRGRKEALSTE
ncbi:hypothetical protein BJX66DRAFT_318308 [Aspergillus keveii]|uniref:Secreted protein n=1 Tax=Aspergillus keveii TaxID=714993 RepID=A0ABR4FJW5_9EURO